MIIRASNKSTQKEMKFKIIDRGFHIDWLLPEIFKKLSSPEMSLRIDIYEKEPDLLNNVEISVLKDIVENSGDWIKRMKLMIGNEHYCPMCGIRPQDIANLSSAIKKLLKENNRF